MSWRDAGRARILAAALPVLLAGPVQALNLGDVGRFLGEHADTIVEGAKHLRKGFEDVTGEEEHYIGRAVAARILGRYPPIRKGKVNRYLNTLGSYLAYFSDRPETWGGYHFALLRSNEVNAFAAPGGFILLTTGLLEQVENEDQLAAVLAHEIAHVTLKHGLSAIQKSNLTQAFTLIGKEVVSEQGGAGVSELASVFGSSVDDIINKLVESGYSREQEYAADGEALRIIYRAGYDPTGLPDFLARLGAAKQGAESAGFYKTHPPTAERIARVDEAIGDAGYTGVTEAARTRRFGKRTSR